MARFTLVLMPNGKALMVTPDDISQDLLHQLMTVWKEWREGHQDVLFVSGADVRLVEDIELSVKGVTMTEEQETPAAEDAEDTEEAAAEETTDEAEAEAEPEAAE
jgi:hypothetical protein